MKTQLHCATHRPSRNTSLRTTNRMAKNIDEPISKVAVEVTSNSNVSKSPKKATKKKVVDPPTKTVVADDETTTTSTTSSEESAEPVPATPPKDRTVKDFKSKDDLRRALQFVDPESGNTDWKLNNFDVKTSFQDPNNVENEVERLLNLKSYDVLETEKEPEFEVITESCKERFGCPIAAISLIDLGRQWFKSISGLEAEQTPRCVAFCAHVVKRKERLGCLVVPDATKDERFKDNPFVTDGLKVRFYAGAPLVTPEGHRLGSLCVIDTEPHPEGLSRGEMEELETYAREVVYHLITRLEDDKMPICKRFG